MKYLKTYNESIDLDKRKNLILNRYKKSTIVMNEDAAIKYVLKNCTEWVDNPIKIKRGIDAHHEYFYSKPVKRLSRDCYNYYTLIMDNAPEWQYYPKRTKSFICSMYEASQGEYEYVVIPEDGSNWGIASNEDIYTCFINGLSNNDLGLRVSLEKFFNIFIRISNIYDIELSDTNWNQFKKGINLLQNKANISDELKTYELGIGDEYSLKIFSTIEKNIIKNGNTLDNLLNILSPEINEFKNRTYQELVSDPKLNFYIENNYECWTDSPCVFVQIKNFNKFLKKLKNI